MDLYIIIFSRMIERNWIVPQIKKLTRQFFLTSSILYCVYSIYAFTVRYFRCKNKKPLKQTINNRRNVPIRSCEIARTNPPNHSFISHQHRYSSQLHRSSRALRCIIFDGCCVRCIRPHNSSHRLSLTKYLVVTRVCCGQSP